MAVNPCHRTPWLHFQGMEEATVWPILITVLLAQNSFLPICVDYHCDQRVRDTNEIIYSSQRCFASYIYI